MSIKLNGLAGYFTNAAPGARTFPNTDWTFSAVVVFDGTFTGNPQYLYSTGAFQAAGSFHMVFEPAGQANAPGRVHLFLDTSASPVAITGGTISAGQAYCFVFQRLSGVVSVRHCPVLSAAPSDASAVISGTAPVSLSTSLVGPANLIVGDRGDLSDSRGFFNSAARLFRLDGVTLTDLEVAKLAYGMEITDLGKTPATYFRANTISDTTDRGTLATTYAAGAAATQTATTGTAPAFGYVPGTAPAAPVITGVPTISNVSVGATASVTPASVTGTPTPTTTFQWNINGITASGATGTTYVPSSGDAGKTLTVTQTSTNTQGTATATSAGTVVSASAAPTMDGAEQTAERIYQRIGTSATVPLSGSWTGATQPSSIEYRLFAPDATTLQKDWATTGATISANGTWSASTSIPQPSNGKKYLIQYRSKDSSGNEIVKSSIKSNRFGVGDIIGFIGSSSAEKAFYTDSGSGFTLDPDVTSRYDGTWYTITTGCAVQIASSLAVQAGVPIAFLDYGIGGSAIADWVNTNYAQWQAFASGVAAVGGKIAACLITIGSNDAAYGYVVSRSGHLANWRTLNGNVRSLTSQPSMPICSIGYNRRTDTTVSATQFAAGSDYVRMAENDIADDPNVCGVQTMDFLLSSDGIHLASVDTGFPAWGRRIAYQFGLFLKGTYLRGPKQTQMIASGVTTVHTLQHRGSTDFTPTTGITGYTALDSSNAAIALVSSVRTNATTITNTWASAPAKVQYLEGSAPPVGTPVFGNTASPLPMTVETDMAMTAVGSGTVTSVTVTPANATVSGGGSIDFDWVVNGTGGPSQAATVTTSLGQINTDGVLTAPAATTSQQNGVVTVTSTQDSTKSGTASFTVLAVTSTVTGVTVTPASVTIAGNGSVDFDWVILGTNSPSQAATVTTTLGTIDGNGILTAPASISTIQSGTVTVKSVQDPSFSGFASFAVQATGVVPVPSISPVIALYSPMLVPKNTAPATPAPFWPVKLADQQLPPGVANVGEYGFALSAGLGYNLSANISLGIKITRPDGTSVMRSSPQVNIGATPLATDFGTFAANEYAVYLVQDGDFTVPGMYTARVIYTDASKRLVSEPAGFVVNA